MEKRIDELISLLQGEDGYDKEGAHILYDELLEDFIKNIDLRLLNKMLELISLEKHFWYA